VISSPSGGDLSNNKIFRMAKRKQAVRSSMEFERPKRSKTGGTSRSEKSSKSEEKQSRQSKSKQKKPIKDTKKRTGRLYTRCSVKYIHDMLNRDKLLEKMSKKHVRALQATPFGHFLQCPDIRVSTKCIQAMLQRWDPNRVGLTIGEKFVEFTAEELSVVLGIPCCGKVVKLAGTKIKSETLKTHFNSIASNFERDQVKATLMELAGIYTLIFYTLN
jgi:hypothetical protein